MGKRMPHFGKRDAVEDEIVKALRGLGAQVYRLSQKGLPDLIVNFKGASYLMEAKGKKGKLTPSQVELHRTWQGAPIHIVHSVAEALLVIGAIINE